MTTVARPPTTTDSSTRDPQIFKAWAAIFLGMGVASFAAIFTRASLNAGMPPLMTSAGRLAIGFTVLTPIVLYHYRDELRVMSHTDRLMAVFAGFWMCLHFSLIALSLENTRIAVTQVLVNTSPLIVAILETVFLKARLPRIVWIGLFMAILGSAVIGADGFLSTESILLAAPENLGLAATDTGNPTLGVIFALVSAGAAALYLVTGRKARGTVSLIPYLWILTGAGTVTGIAILLLTATPAFGHSTEAYFWLMMLAFGPQLITHSGINYAVAYLPATIVTIASQFVTVTATIAAFIFFAEVPSVLELIGAAIILSGVMVAILGRNRS